MAKKLICFPFVEGNLLDYCDYTLTDDKAKQVYENGEFVDDCPYYRAPIVWKPVAEVELTIRYNRCTRGRSAVTFYWIDTDNNEYPMFLSGMDKILKENIVNLGLSDEKFVIHGIFAYVKRGANYGIEFVRKADSE